MLKRILLAALLLGAFAYGLTHLFLLRFQTGEVYPVYCSLRSDPLGTKAFADSLRELPHLDVRRNFRGIVKLRPDAPVTLFYAGTPHNVWWQDSELRHVEELAVAGSRIVITFLPVDRGPGESEAKRLADLEKTRKEKRLERRSGEKLENSEDDKSGDKTKADKNAKDAKQDEEAQPLTMYSFTEVAERWGFQFRYFPHRDASALARIAKVQEPGPETEPALSWHTAMHFGKPGNKWRTIYSVEGSPVIIERSFGAGSVVLAADTYFLSNEALRKERAPSLLAWLVGKSPTVIFDEESHGVRDNPGVVSLIRKYGLHGVAAGLLFIAALFIWKNATHLVPPTGQRDEDEDLVHGRESGEGLINLLRRSIAPPRLLAICAEEWKKAFDPTGKSLKLAHLEKVVARERDPVAAYRTIAEVLSQKK